MRGTDTRERLLDAALALFADHGYANTSVGEIEAAAGLMPRSGGLYRHFASKEDLLRVAVEREIEATERLATEFAAAALPARDGSPENARGPRQILADVVVLAFGMRSRYRLRRIFASGDPIPTDLALRFREIVERTQASAAAGFAAIAAQNGRTIDANAVATMISAAITQFTADQATPLKGILGVDEERLQTAMVETVAAALGVPD